MAQNPNMLAPKTPVLLQKSILELLLIFDPFFIDFWSHLGAKIAPKTAQDGPKTRPRRPLGPILPPKTVQDGAKMRPRRAQDGHLG